MKAFLKGKFSIGMVVLWMILSLAIKPVMAQKQDFRQPATPLIVCNPYFSFWSFTDHPGKDWTRHWTGSSMGMASLVSVDGKTYRLLGRALGDDVSPMPLVKKTVTPTSTGYIFETEGCRITMTFLNPMIPTDLDLLSKSLGYITWEAEPTDNKLHNIAFYFDSGAEPALNNASQSVIWSRLRVAGMDVLSFASKDQPILEKKGDDLRIDWGTFLTASPQESGMTNAIVAGDQARESFFRTGVLPLNDDLRMPRPASDQWPVHAWVHNFGKISSRVSWHMIMAMDEGFNTEFLFRKLRPYWKRNGASTTDMLMQAERDYIGLQDKCRKFDNEVMSDLTRTGGDDYCDLGVMAYRQSLGAHGLSADIDGTPYYFPKENFSNGCIATVDVIYPASPVLLFFNPSLLKACLDPLFRYVETGRWKFPFAPHDLGTYPLANGQVYGGGELTEEDQMPVEESGNMLLMMYAITIADHSPDYASKYYDILRKWAYYLKEKGFDPENQLCTDDFAGHLAHNTNLSIKAILALEAFAKISEQTNHPSEAKEFSKAAAEFSKRWKKEANDGDHFRLAFDKQGSWSQKYNLVWDKILGMNLFDKDIAEKETRFYLKKQNTYGLPLDNRADYTKSDWIVWTATLSNNDADFKSFISPLHLFYNDTRDRKPMTDWYDTKTCKQFSFQARSVVGGIYMKMLSDKELWNKWVQRTVH